MKTIRRDFTADVEVPDHINADEVEMVATVEASYHGQTVQPKIAAGEPYLVKEE